MIGSDQSLLRQAAQGIGTFGTRPFNTFEDFSLYDRCITRGMPASMFTINYNNGIRLWQAPGLVVIQLEMVHEARVIPLDGRPHGRLRQWMGDARGHWEGETLVVETVNFPDLPNSLRVSLGLGKTSAAEAKAEIKRKIKLDSA